MAPHPHPAVPGCLLLHGFSGSPLEMQPLADALHREGWVVEVARLAGHGVSPSDLARATWRDWVRSAEDAYAHLARRSSPVAVIGLSMGGALALYLGATAAPAAVVAVSTPVRVHTVLARASRVAARVLPYVPVLVKLGPREREMRQYRSPSRRIPLRATEQVDQLLAEVRAALPRVRVPVLLVQGRRDWVIPKESGRQLAALTGAAEVRLLWLPRSGHVATLDRDRHLLYREVIAFLRPHLRHSGRQKGGAHGAAD